MKLYRVALFLIPMLMFSVVSAAQIENCEVKIVPDDLNGDKVTVNLSDLCSNCGPYGGNNGTIDNPPNGATGCAIVKFTEAILINCVTIGIDPQSTEKTDYYFNPLVSTMDCFMPDGTTSSQGEVFEINIENLTLNNGFYDVLICSQSTGNRSYEVTIGCCPSAGTGTETEICETDTNPVDLYSLLTGEDPGGTWTRISGTGGVFNAMDGSYIAAIDATTSEFQYAAPSDPNAQECNFTSTVTVNITPSPQVGNDNSLTLCSDGMSVNLFDYIGMDAEASGSWTGPSVLSGDFQGTFDPQINGPGVYQYVVLGTGSCENDTSEVTVSLETAPNAGSDGTLSFCNDSQPSMNLVEGLGGMPDPGGSWNPTTNTPGVFDPSIDSPGTYTYEVTGNTPCGNSSAMVEVTVSSTPDAGENGSATFCSNGASENLEDFLNGTPDGGGMWSPSLNSGTSLFDPAVDMAGQYTYSFNIQDCETNEAVVSVVINDPPSQGNNAEINICSDGDVINLYDYIGDPGQDGNWSGPSTLDNGYLGTYNPSDDDGGQYLYTIQGIDPCGDAITNVIINKSEVLYPGRDTMIEVCISDNAIDLFALLGDDVEKGGTWTPELDSGTDMFMPAIDGPGSYTYTIAGEGGCMEQSATITTAVVEGNHAGQSAYILVSSDDAPFNLFSLLTMDPDIGGNWDPAPVSGTGMFDPGVDVGGVYTYNVKAVPPCEADFANVTVELFAHEAIPTMGTWGIIILLLFMLIVGKVSISEIQIQRL